jgi:hypothetical protein
MKKFKTRKIAIALALASVPFLAGCGKGNSSNPTGYIPGSVYGNVPGGCIPVNTAQIPFTGTNVNYSGQGLVAGQLPNGQAAGQMALGGGVIGAGQFHGQSVDGTLLVNLNGGAVPVGPGYPPYSGGTSSIVGTVSISQATQQDIAFQMGGYGGYNPYPAPYPQQPVQQSVCISGIAISGSIYSGTFYNTSVYLYMNGTTHGYALYF